MSDHDSVQDLLPGFALGCLDQPEEAAVRRHLRACAECRRELRSYQDVAEALPETLPLRQPPGGLEERIVSRLRSRREPIPMWNPRVRVLGAIAAGLILVLGAGNVVQLARGGSAGSAAGTLDSIVLKGTEKAPGAFGIMVLDLEDNRGVLAVRGLPALDAGHQYQLWLVQDKERRSAGVFSVSADGYGNLLITVPKDFRGFARIGISVEPAGGSPAPTGARMMSGSL